MPEQKAKLRINGRGEVRVELIIEYLTDLRHAYNSILVFEATMDKLHQAYSANMHPSYPAGLAFLLAARSTYPKGKWPLSVAQTASLVPVSQRLVLSTVRLESPGFSELVGLLKPLETIRQYLNDRHERRKDREYREGAEKRKLELENFKLENDVLSGRIKVMKEPGATENDFAP